MRRVVYLLAAIAVAAVVVVQLRGPSGPGEPGRVAAAPAAPAGLPERFQMRLLGERYRLSEQALAQARQDSSSMEDVALAANVSVRAGVPFADVIKARRGGEEWLALGKRLGVREEEMIEPVAARPPAEDEAFLRQILQERFRLSDLLVGRLRREGFSSGEIVVAAVITGGRESDVVDALYAHRAGRGWQSASTHVAVGPARAPGGSAPPEPAGREDDAHAAPYYRALLKEHYGVRAEDAEAAARKGVRWSDLPVVANVAARSKQTLSQVAALRAEGLPWGAIEQRLGMRAGDALRFEMPRGQAPAAPKRPGRP